MYFIPMNFVTIRGIPSRRTPTFLWLVLRPQSEIQNSAPMGPAYPHLLQPPDWFVPQSSNHFTGRDSLISALAGFCPLFYYCKLFLVSFNSFSLRLPRWWGGGGGPTPIHYRSTFMHTTALHSCTLMHIHVHS